MIALTATKTLLDVIVNRFQNEKQLLVYGAGRNAGIFCSSMKDSACQLVFFDRRAEKEEFFFDGRRVFPPREMLNYPGAPVLVTPFSLQEKIIEQIAGMGIEKSRIYAFPRDPEVPAGISMLTLSDDPESVYRLGPPIPFTRDLFSAAMDRITDWDLTDYPVISSEGEMLFFLHVSWLNTLSQCDNAGLSVVVPNLYPGGELKKVLEQLDLSLLSAYDGYVFEEVEGYTFALTELILSLWPERPVWYRDSRAALFWGSEQVTILPDNDDSELPRNRNLMTVSNFSDFLRNESRGEALF